MNLDDELMRRTKARAASEGRTMTALIEEALREYLRADADAPGFTLDWEPVPGRFCAGVDVSDRDSLYEAMEGRG